MKKKSYASLTSIPMIRGCGATAIYALLGTRLFGWKFIAAEKDPDSVEIARKQVELNEFQDNIDVRHTGKDDTILLSILAEGERASFCMCNPPFFESVEERKSDKDVGRTHEMYTEGGEYGFISRMISESKEIGETVNLFSCLIGKKSSIKSIAKKLRESGVNIFRFDHIDQGKNRRWIVAWSYRNEMKEAFSREYHAPNPFSRVSRGKKRKRGSRCGSEILTFRIEGRITEAWEKVRTFLEHTETIYIDKFENIICHARGSVRRSHCVVDLEERFELHIHKTDRGGELTMRFYPKKPDVDDYELFNELRQYVIGY